MFTGIVQNLVPVVSVSHHTDISKLTLDLTGTSQNLQTGASVAVNGVCLTVVNWQGNHVNFDVISQTIRTTNLSQLKAGQLVNVERSFAAGDEIGGHIVSGHVCGTATLLQRRVQGHDHVLRLDVAEHMRYIFNKGFVALDGASLTVSDINKSEGWLEISLIPETLARTTLASYEEGAQINLEVDSSTVATVDSIESLLADEHWLQLLKQRLRD